MTRVSGNAAMSEFEKKARDLFLQAIDLHADEVVDFLATACDGELRQRVRQLLDAHREAGDFVSPSEVEATFIQADEQREREATVGTTIAMAETPGSSIGPYKLLEQVGEGGMGSVWVASQSRPIKRMVAIKLIKAGMD